MHYRGGWVWNRGRRQAMGLCLLAALVGVVEAQQPAEWTQPQAPVRIFGNTYYVGTRGLGAILIASPTGAVLIDGAVREAAEQIARNITAVGVRLQDVRLILNSHVHEDHAGGIAELQRRTGAVVAATAWSARVLRDGRKDPADPQFATSTPPAPRVATVRTVRDGEVLRAGAVAITARLTGGHTPGGTTWTWRSCEGGRCLDLVYADSLTAVSADGFRFTDSAAALGEFRRSFSVLRAMSCDILLTPHPEASDLWARVARREAGEPDALIDRSRCASYADRAEAQLRLRLEREAAR